MASSSAGPSACHSSQTKSWNAVCISSCDPMGKSHLALLETTCCGSHGRASKPPSPPYACGTSGPLIDKHGSTPYPGRTVNLSSQTRPLGRMRSQAPPHYPCMPSSPGLQAPSCGAQSPTLWAHPLSSRLAVMTKGTIPLTGYWEPLARIVEWPRNDGEDVHVLGTASKAQHRPHVRVRIQLWRPKAHRSRNGVSSADRSPQEMV